VLLGRAHDGVPVVAFEVLAAVSRACTKQVTS
jgi:hypothetical protein